MKKALIMAGGTGGHIFPALAVADALKAKGVAVYWLGTPTGLETRLVPDRYPMTTLPIKALRGKGLMKKVLAPWRVISATFKAYRIIQQLKPDVVLGMGGYVAGPGGLAAWLARMPLVIHEQNAVSGLTNRCLSYVATCVLQAYPGAFSKRRHAMTVGNPVRADLSAASAPAVRFEARERASAPLQVLILGGSQGAHAINERVIEALADCPDETALSFWHQSGRYDVSLVTEGYQRFHRQAKVEPFIEDMRAAYEWADCVICRAGALTVSEVMAVGVPSIFVPYPHAVDDHQWHNSRFLEEAGAAMVIRESELSKEHLSVLLQQFSKDRPRLLAMAERARALAQPQAVARVVAACEKVAR